MPTEPQSEAYVLGVRAKQLALVLQMEPEPEAAHARIVQSLALRYCQALETDQLGEGREAAYLRRRAANIEETAASEREGIGGGQRNAADAEALQTDMELSAAALPPGTRDWFRLALEVVDGRESRRREGPPLVDRAGERIPNPGLPEAGLPPMEGSHWDRACGAWLAPNGLPMPPNSVRASDEEARTYQHPSLFEPAAPRWAWRDPQRLLELLGATGTTLQQLLPTFADRRWSFGCVDARERWLWEYVEVGIGRLSLQAPRWDARTGTLAFGEVVIRTFRRESIQRAIVEAFSEAGWTSAIEFTTGDPEQRRRAVYVLNDGLLPELMHFSEDGDALHWRPGPRPERADSASAGEHFR